MKNELEKVLKQLGVFEKVDELGLDSPCEILSKSVTDLQKLLRIDSAAANTILNVASSEAYDWRMREKTGDELIQGPQTLTTGDPTIDKVLNGGIYLGMLTEVVGESSSGKTQLALQLCLTAQKSIQQGGLEGSAVYIHSEGPFPSSRLEQLTAEYPSSEREEIKTHIHTIRIKDSEDQYRVLAYQLPAFLEMQRRPGRKRVRVVVVDSISAIYRSEPTQPGKRYEKMSQICEIGTRLKKMASEHGVAIVAVNQVSDVPTSNTNSNLDQLESWMDFQLVNNKENNHMIGLYIQSLLKKPVLGLSWSNAVNTRIRLARSPMLESMQTRRVLFLEFSSAAPRLGCEVIIKNNGLHALTLDQ